MPATRREILQLLERLEESIRAAYMADVFDITDRAQIAALERAVAAGDEAAILRAAGFRPGSWTQMTEAIRNSYIEAGIATVAADVPFRFGMDFDWRNPRAETWLRQHSSQLVTLINAEQREAIQEVLQAGLVTGRNPRNVALDIVGRVSPQTGRRAGGIVGLNAPQAQAAMNARGELENLNSNYFTRQRRDRRFDSIVRKAIATETALPQTDINRIVGRYEDRLLELRGTTIGRTEALASLNEASDESLRQVVDQGLAPPSAIERIWDATMDARTRPSHASMEGQNRGLNEPFVTGDGALMMHPGDTSLGAGAGDVINCRCIVKHKIDFVAVELAA